MPIKIINKKKSIKVLIVAAGEGKRSGLNYPKTLFKINNTPIIVRIIKKIIHIDNNPTIIVSNSGLKMISKCLKQYKYNFELLVQSKPRGMGDAILKYKKSKSYEKKDNILLIWGDLPFLYKKTIDQMIFKYFSTNSFITLATGIQKNPYTLVIRDNNNSIREIEEFRKKKIQSNKGERDIGIFLFNKKLLNILNSIKKYDYIDGKKEHNFLYIVKILYIKKYRITSSLISNKKEFKSLNYIDDIR